MGKKHRQSKLTARKKAFKSEQGSKAANQSGRGKKLGVGKLGVSKHAKSPKVRSLPFQPLLPMLQLFNTYGFHQLTQRVNTMLHD